MNHDPEGLVRLRRLEVELGSDLEALCARYREVRAVLADWESGTEPDRS
ncbi:MAG: hypothetical protein JW940_05170 [Polyangiaceae bacterium]|nr:hypothetical protein [Polyangiaceae bacterium]